jgi:hypothetical protein
VIFQQSPSRKVVGSGSALDLFLRPPRFAMLQPLYLEMEKRCQGKARDTAASTADRRAGRWGAAANVIIPPKGPTREHIHRFLNLPDAQQALRDVIVKVRVKINGGRLDHSHRLSDRGPTPVGVPTAEKDQHSRSTTPRCRRVLKAL